MAQQDIVSANLATLNDKIPRGIFSAIVKEIWRSRRWSV